MPFMNLKHSIHDGEKMQLHFTVSQPQPTTGICDQICQKHTCYDPVSPCKIISWRGVILSKYLISGNTWVS